MPVNEIADGLLRCVVYSCPFGVLLQKSLEMMMRRSHHLAVILTSVHLVALGTVWMLTLEIVWHLALKLVILGSLLHSLRQAGWLGNDEFPLTVRLKAGSRGDEPERIDITDAAGRVMAGEVVEGSLVLSGLVILRCRMDGVPRWRGIRSWVLFADSLDPDAHRRLRVRLRWGRARPV